MPHSETNRRIVLASRPKGTPAPADFRLEQVPMPSAPEGGVLLRTLYLSLDPYMRGMMNERAPAYTRSIAISEVMPGGTVNRVIASGNPRFKAGDLVLGMMSTADPRTFTAGSGFTIQELVPPAPYAKLAVETRVQPAAGAVSASGTLSSSNTWSAAFAAFRPAGGGQAPAPQ